MLAKTGGLDTADGGTADGVAAGTTADVVAVAGGLHVGGTADGVAAGAMAEVVACSSRIHWWFTICKYLKSIHDYI